ncbi:MAG: cell wall metabolism sensor histidine kinase WalK [Candidatus Omnitrophica bacterium]|nr:cell wall metabolism sensor histidine kinase WalK [Candidatus Omnitrophota bacterium]
MRVRIYWKLTFIFCSLILIILTAVYFYLNTNLKIYIETRIQDTLKKDLLLSKDFLDNELSQPISPAGANSLAKRIDAALGARATIIAPDGVVIGDSELDDKSLANIENHITRTEVQNAVQKGFGQSKRFSTTIKKDMLYMAVPLGKEKITGIFRLAIPLSDIEMIESKMLKAITAVTIFAIIATLGASFLVSIMISRPLCEMSVIAKRLAAGDFSRKAIIHANDEIGDLASALNEMAEQLSAEVKNLSSEKAKLEAILASMFEGILLTNERGEISLANPSIRKLFLIDSPPEGKRPLEVIRNNEVQEIVDKVLNGKNEFITKEVRISMPEKKTVLINGIPIVKDNKIESAVFVFHDITELKRLEDMRKDFVANVSHELRTPISSIKGYAETLLDGKADSEETVRDFLGIIYQDSNRLANLIDDLLDLSRIESGKMKMELEELDIAPIARRCFNVLEKSAKDKSIAVTLDIPSGLPCVMGDEKRLVQVFLNLLDNAVKYTPAGGKVILRASLKDKAVQIDISDTGIGISEKDLPRIFERFYRVDKARSRELGGTGLGLSIVKHIVQAHNGQIWVQSTPGKGSTFSFTIPVA